MRPAFFMSFVALITLATTACATDEGSDPTPTPTPSGDCVNNTTQACLCSGGDSGVQTCSGGSWGSCACDGTPLCTAGATQACACSSGTGTQTCMGGTAWGTCQCPTTTQPKHGDNCVSPEFDCGPTSNNLACVVDNPNDTQGTCRRSCNMFSDCLNHQPALQLFDTDCCDVGNGGRVCDQKAHYPEGACN